MTLFIEEPTSALAGFHAGPLSWSNWNLESDVNIYEGRRTREEGLNGVNRQPSNGQKNNRQSPKNEIFLPSTMK